MKQINITRPGDSLNNTVKRIIAIGLLGMLGLLSACGGGGGGGSSTPPPPPDTPITAINDPFIEHQWSLYNSGQAALVYDGTGGVPGADINVFGAGEGVDAYAQGFTGDGVHLAIIDEGMEIGHEDLSPNVVLNGSYNFSNNGKSLFDPTSTFVDGDHGTSVAGLSGARGGNSLGIWGVAPSVELHGFNFLASQEFNEELAALGYKESADQFVGLTSTQIDVFNKSYGRNPDYVPEGTELTYYQTIMDALEWGTNNLRALKGAVYVKAAGNEFYSDSGSCANGMTCYNVNMETEHATPFQMVVGAFNASDRRASYSNTGSALWLSAPGGEFGVESPTLVTTDQSGCTIGYSRTNTPYGIVPFDDGAQGTGNESCNYFSRFNGTSSSTAMVSGAAALLLEANPNLTWRDVKHVLASTARQIDPDLSSKTLAVNSTSVVLENGWVTNNAGIKYSNAYGFGALNVDAAITLARTNYSPLLAMQTVSTPVFSLSTDNEIPDFNAAGLSKITTVNSTLTAESVLLTLSIVGRDSNTEGNVAHNIDLSDYQILLTSPSGTQSIVLTPFNAYLPHYDMNNLMLISHAFYGEALNGNWTVTVRDLDNSTNGTGLGKLVNWSLTLYGH
ncbi:S8 family serine peptidase [Thiomicrorhabdus aquaedulcis]|uniref:S8 family serine peptidase n=1 Tax=Thiomicrorhabdus aquaedulcis TaxID=2211106 RepID=UPI000FDBC1E9|nr:S8 family serine peptidase [Thiomicrorhabdus aquaedulcis]